MTLKESLASKVIAGFVTIMTSPKVPDKAKEVLAVAASATIKKVNS